MALEDHCCSHNRFVKHKLQSFDLRGPVRDPLNVRDLCSRDHLWALIFKQKMLIFPAFEKFLRTFYHNKAEVLDFVALQSTVERNPFRSPWLERSSLFACACSDKT